MADTKIPVKKLVDSGGYYYPLTTLESVVSAEGITVKNTVGSYRPNDVIDPKTTLKTILFRILTQTGEADAVLHLSNVDVDTLRECSTRVPSSPLVAELLQKLRQDIEKKLIKAAHYRGSVNYYKDLPTETAICGDIYNVKYKGTSGTEPDGNNYIFDEDKQEWDKLAGFVDLGNYYTKTEIDSKLSSLKIYIDTQDNSIRNEYVKKIDATGSVTAEAGKCITGITQIDGKITSVTSAKLGTDVTVTPTVSSGTKLADIKVDNLTTPIYSPYTSGIIETWRSGYSWYRLYSDGWIEQGGIVTCESSSKSLLIPYHKEMRDSACSVQVTQDDNTGNDTIVPFKKIHNQSRIIVSWENFSTPTFDWKCTGFTSGVPVTYYTVTFNPNGGTVSETTRSVIKDSAIGPLPVPTYSGYSFKGWYTAQIGGTKITNSTIISNNVMFYAQWEEESIDDLLCLEEDHSKLIITEDKIYNINLAESTEPVLATEIQHDPVVTEDKLNGISLKDSSDPALATEIVHDPVVTEDKLNGISLKDSSEPLLSTEVVKENVNTEDYDNKLKV